MKYAIRIDHCIFHYQLDTKGQIRLEKWKYLQLVNKSVSQSKLLFWFEVEKFVTYDELEHASVFKKLVFRK